MPLRNGRALPQSPEQLRVIGRGVEPVAGDVNLEILYLSRWADPGGKGHTLMISRLETRSLIQQETETRIL